MELYIVDAFTQVTFGGNPAGVVLLDEGTDFPSEEIMIKTAAELRYSETAFVKKTGEDEFNIRYFTPAAEVELCGHATIASFWVLKEKGLCRPGKIYLNRTLSGDIYIEVREDFIMMDMATPSDLGNIDTEEALEELYEVLGAKYEKVLVHKSPVEHIELLPKIISTGLPDIMVPIVDFNVLMNLAPNFEALSELSKKYEVVGVHAFAIDEDDPDYTAHTRNFAPLYDIDEEAATGTSSGALSYYLYELGLVKENEKIKFLQGESMKRPSNIVCNIAKEETGTLKIRVGGCGVTLAKGHIFI